MAQSVAEVIKIGPAQVSYGTVGTNLTFMSVKGATVKWTPKTTDAKVSKYGDSAVATFYTGGELSVEFEMSQTDYTILSGLTVGTAEGDVSSGHPAVGFGMAAGTQVVGQQLTITPENVAYSAAGSSNYIFTVWLAVPAGEPEFLYTTEGAENVYKVKFKANYDPTHDAGSFTPAAPLGLWGNPS